MLVCSKCGFSQIVTHRCPQCHEAWMEEKSTSHNKDYVELEKQRDELIEFLSEVIEAEELKEDIAVIIDEATEDWINEQIKEGENNLLREQLGGKVRSKK